ncbi:MAG: hypothetical protein R6U96_03535 [Promethearchaeia archaeon]
MTIEKQKIAKIIHIEEYIDEPTKFSHLFEVQLPPEKINLWKPRRNFNMGTPLIGDLYLDLEEEDMLEIHPFPEWVVQLYYPANQKSIPYLVVPNLPKAKIRKLRRKSIDQKIDIIDQEIKHIKIENLIAFEYKVGINIMVRAFIPHFFISSHIDKEKGENPPYLQVFEPELSALTENLEIKTSYFFRLPYKVYIS